MQHYAHLILRFNAIAQVIAQAKVESKAAIDRLEEASIASYGEKSSSDEEKDEEGEEDEDDEEEGRVKIDEEDDAPISVPFKKRNREVADEKEAPIQN